MHIYTRYLIIKLKPCTVVLGGVILGNINFFIVFIEGLLSIFSPCILPILPIYLSMLSNSSIEDIKDSKFRRGVLFKNTLFFTLGISATFFILGSSIKILTTFLNTNKDLIMIIGGLIIIIMGLFYIDVIKLNFLNKEKRFNVQSESMSQLSAFILGFTFSFGWTPCIGPILASVLIMASTESNIITSNILILVYTIGFILPFIVASLFYNKLYKKFDKIKNYMPIIKKISGGIIIIAGIFMLINGGVNVKRELSNAQNVKSESSSNNESSSNKENAGKSFPVDFTLKDQYGNEHKLSDYKGKTVFLNFWATWCPPCRQEMPYIEEIYNEYNKNQDDVVILGVASPELGREGTQDYVEKYLQKEGFTFPVAMDIKGSILYKYEINSFPSTFIINKEGYIEKYIPGAINKSTMKSLIENAK